MTVNGMPLTGITKSCWNERQPAGPVGAFPCNRSPAEAAELLWEQMDRGWEGYRAGTGKPVRNAQTILLRVKR